MENSSKSILILMRSGISGKKKKISIGLR